MPAFVALQDLWFQIQAPSRSTDCLSRQKLQVKSLRCTNILWTIGAVRLRNVSMRVRKEMDLLARLPMITEPTASICWASRYWRIRKTNGASMLGLVWLITENQWQRPAVAKVPNWSCWVFSHACDTVKDWSFSCCPCFNFWVLVHIKKCTPYRKGLQWRKDDQHVHFLFFLTGSFAVESHRWWWLSAVSATHWQWWTGNVKDETSCVDYCIGPTFMSFSLVLNYILDVLRIKPEASHAISPNSFYNYLFRRLGCLPEERVP